MKYNSVMFQCSSSQKTCINLSSSLAGNFLFPPILGTMTSNRSIFAKDQHLWNHQSTNSFFPLHLRMALFWKRIADDTCGLMSFTNINTSMYIYGHTGLQVCWVVSNWRIVCFFFFSSFRSVVLSEIVGKCNLKLGCSSLEH